MDDFSNIVEEGGRLTLVDMNTNVVNGDLPLYYRSMARPTIKIAELPQIVVCMPIGDKDQWSVFACPDCQRQYGQKGLRAHGLVPIQWATNHMNWVSPLNVSMSYLFQAGSLSAEAREVMTKVALKSGAKYVFYNDDDTLIPPMGLYTLHNFLERHPEIGAVMGVYTTRQTPPELLIYGQHGKGCYWDMPLGPDAEPVPVMGGGAGCLLARVEAMQAVLKQDPDSPLWADERAVLYNEEVAVERRVMWGHDMRFCKRLWEAGWPVYGDGRVLCGHWDIEQQKLFEVPPDAPGFEIAKKLKEAKT